MQRFSDPERLQPEHSLSGFACGEPSLDTWLERHSLPALGSGSATTFVVTDTEQDGRVVGYHALAAASSEPSEATGRAKKGMPEHPIPALLLARLAVDTSVKSRRLGAYLLRDAMLRTVSASDEIGVRVLLAHALNNSARDFYVRFGFEQSPTDDLNLQIIVKDIKAAIT